MIEKYGKRDCYQSVPWRRSSSRQYICIWLVDRAHTRIWLANRLILRRIIMRSCYQSIQWRWSSSRKYICIWLVDKADKRIWLAVRVLLRRIVIISSNLVIFQIYFDVLISVINSFINIFVFFLNKAVASLGFILLRDLKVTIIKFMKGIVI